MKKISLVWFLVLLIGQLMVPARMSTVSESKIKVTDKVQPKAIPFGLNEVRLLDGPFRQAMLRDQKFILAIDPDRLLHNFRVTAGLPSSAKPLGGWEAPDVELRGHTLGHFLSACALMYSSTGEERFKTIADGMVMELAKIQAAMPSRGFHPGYLSAFPEELFDRVDARVKVWAPYYTIHKIMAGLLDVYVYCGNRQALEVVTKQADWVKFRVDRLTEEQQQAALQTEHGGMIETLADIYAVTGNAEYLRVARKFDHKALFDPLARAQDPLDGLHGNTQIPKMIGAAREYELTGEKKYYDIASFFWDRVVKYRSFVIGGNTDGEQFFPIDTFSKHLGSASTETCNTYNMLKLTRHLFAWEPSAEKMDFYERGLYNHILASQDPSTGMMCYYVPLRPGAFKTFSTQDQSFWCCVGTGMENHSKYPDTIYFHNDQSLYVNLFIASELDWKEKGLVVRQETRFPQGDTTRLTFKSDQPVKLALKIRYPAWAQSGMTLTINGERQAVDGNPGSYVTVDHVWKTADTVEVRLPMSLHTEALPDDPKMVAVMYGPIVLAGKLGKEGLEASRIYGPNAPQLGRLKPVEAPVFVGDIKDIPAKVKAVAGQPLTFNATGLSQPNGVTLVPFYSLYDERYTVYWKVNTPAEWEKHKAETAAMQARRKEVERRTIDAVNIADAQNEREHSFKSKDATEGFFEGKRTREARNGWFSYELKVLPDKPVILVCSYRGSEGRRRAFDILVDGEKLKTETLENHPTSIFDMEYALPENLTHGKQRITIEFHALPDSTAGAVVDVRTIQ